MFIGVMTGRNGRLASLAVLALLAAFWLGRTLAPAGRAVPPSPESGITAPEQPAVLEADANADGAELEAERARSQELAAQVAWLLAQLARLGQEAASPPPAAAGPTAAVAEASSRAAPEPHGRQAARLERLLAESEFGVSAFDGSDFLANGVPPSEVERLRNIVEEVEMGRVEIARKALREGWLDQRRFQKELAEFEFAKREEMGDESYDAMLYATGQENRVRIRKLVGKSPGGSFGLELDDVVLSYDGRRILSARDLRHATSFGQPGEWVAVDVLRNGEVLRIQGQRGPIGARTQPTRMLPGALW